MKRKLAFDVAALLLALVVSGSSAHEAARPAPITIHSVSVNLPSSAATFPPGPGSDIAAKCLICHSAGMVLRQPALSQAAWKAEINKMRTVYGAPIDETEVDTLTVYMTKVNADQQSH
ncbi:sulfite:cytochrome C oxidoreductase subunit B [Dyella lipolytica]|uniref:Cytochrome c n=1 Tax=Dyella lipolytica TaxID=1867835 RepID=A0ABW8IPZ5_9GAMM|nr:hypothetical protein [Dyella lipolytica]GLQ48537.1 sulfite:cytochrome C oxidoreductase subunit B [Dyella lipolytica]